MFKNINLKSISSQDRIRVITFKFTLCLHYPFWTYYSKGRLTEQQTKLKL